ITGAGMRPSPRFRLEAREGEEVVVHVTPGGTKGGRAAGVVMVVVGATAIGLGAIYSLVAFVAGGGSAFFIGPAIVGGGIAVMTPGIVVMASNPVTEQRQETRPAALSAPIVNFAF